MIRYLTLITTLSMFIFWFILNQKENELEIDFFFSQLEIHLANSYQANLNEDALKQEKIIYPFNSWIVLGQFSYFSSQKPATLCLFFHTPYKNKKGSLKFISLPDIQVCEDHLYSERKNEMIEVDSLSLKYNPEERFLSFLINDNKRKIFLSNVPQKAFSYKRFSLSSSKRAYQGLLFLGLAAKNFSSKSFNIPLAKKNLCHNVSSSCKNLTKFKCHLCEGGFFSEVSLCPQGGRKFCGPSHCGEKGEVACMKGIFQLKEKENGDYCRLASQISFCQQGLFPQCNEEKMIICEK